MAKYNKFDIGYVVGHVETPSLKFRILDVFRGEPETEGNYLYPYSQIFEEDENTMDDIFMGLNDGCYHENDLFFIRKPTNEELNQLLQEAILESQRFDSIISDIRNNLKKMEGLG